MACQAEARSAKAGAGNRSRTYDLRITNALLYQLSYAGVHQRYRAFASVRLERSTKDRNNSRKFCVVGSDRT